MTTSVNAKLAFKGILLALFGIAVAAISIVAVGSFGDYFELSPLHATIPLSGSLGIDFYGAVVPIIIAIVSVASFIRSTNAPVKKLAVALISSFVLALFLCHPTDLGLVGTPLLFALLASLVAAVVTVYSNPFSNLRRIFVSSLMLTLTCEPISLLFIDLLYMPYFDASVIGGGGLSDGLLLSTLYAPASVVVVYSALAYLHQLFCLAKKNRL